MNSGFGLFGIFWTAAAIWATFISFKNGFTDEGVPTREIIIEDTDAVVSSNDIEARLTQLDPCTTKVLSHAMSMMLNEKKS